MHTASGRASGMAAHSEFHRDEASPPSTSSTSAPRPEGRASMRRKRACLAGLHIGPSASAPQLREGGHRPCARPTRSLDAAHLALAARNVGRLHVVLLLLDLAELLHRGGLGLLRLLLCLVHAHASVRLGDEALVLLGLRELGGSVVVVEDRGLDELDGDHLGVRVELLEGLEEGVREVDRLGVVLRVGEVAGLHLVLLLDDRSPRLAVRNLLRRRLDCELGILEQPGKSGRAHVEVVGALAARVDEGEIVRVIVGLAVLVHIVVLVVLLLHRLGHSKQLLPGDVRRSRREVDTTHRADTRVLGRGCRSNKASRWRDGGRAHRRLLAVSNGHHGCGSRPGIVLPGFCSLGLPGL
mmetsp:Transcript_74660/g.148371  ORF Transcript_74660/g.148371 Transcript_74660/m.148371 type:complete len:354 (-) Transcript_74660:168-1229(-)